MPTTRTPHPTALLLVVLLGISAMALGTFAQDSESPPEQSPGIRLDPVPMPDLTAYEPVVARQLRQVQAALGVVLERAMSEAPPSPGDMAESFGEVGRHYHAYGLLDAASVSYANAARLSPGDPRWPHLLGRARQEAGDLEAAEAAFQAALGLAPDDVPALLYLAQIRVLQGDSEAAQTLYRRALALEPGSASALVGLGEAALEAGQPARAVEFLEAALETNPAANRLHHPLGLAYKELGDAERARTHLETAGTVGIRIDDPLVASLEDLKSGERVHLLRGHMAFRAGRFAEAADAYHQAADEAPNSVAAQINLATALSRLGYSQGAEERLRQALALDPEAANTHYNLGVLLIGRNELAGAELHLRRASSLAPQDALVRTNLADVVAGQDPEAALDLYREAQALPGAGEGAYLGEVRLLLAAGRPGDAVARADAGFEAVPSSLALLGTLGRLLAASPDLESRDGERAVDLAERFYAVNQNLSSGELLAMANAEAGRCNEAAEIQAQVIDVARANNVDAVIPAFEAELERYRSGPPCRPAVAGGDSPTPAPAADPESPGAR